VEELTEHKQQPRKNISITGSATLVRSRRSPRRARLLFPPSVLGTGKRLFEDWANQMPVKLVESRAFSTGVLSLTYEPAGT
jgi:dihydrofolate reductase